MRIRQQIRQWLYWRGRRRAQQARTAAMGGLELPPGRLCPFDRLLKTDQHAFLKAARRWGPIFKTVWNGHWLTYVVGHGRARRLLQGNEDRLFSWTPDLSPLFPGGAIRGMQGETHRAYRRVFQQAIQATPLEAHEAPIRALIHDGLHALTVRFASGPVPREAISEALRRISTRIFLRLLLGLGPESSRVPEIEAAYRRFGPAAPAYAIHEEEVAAFAEIRALVEPHAEEIRRDPARHPPSALKHLVLAGSLDPTAFGNLLYMLESSNHDVYSLWRWIVKFLVGGPAVVQRLRAGTPSSPAARRLAEAVVLETLRLAQSEVLLRRVTADIAFDGYLVPKGSVVWVGIWEGHKDPAVFPDPFRFDPDRFLRSEYEIDQYTPFGMDHRRCLGTEIALGTSRRFVEVLARDFDCVVVADGPAMRGPFHWEPSQDFAIRIAPRAS